jgi:hypothetical protein
MNLCDRDPNLRLEIARRRTPTPAGALKSG